MILAQARKTIGERRLLRRGDGVLVACSGGPDSVAMMDVLHRLAPELGIRLEVACVDHGLRSEAAQEVEAVRGQAGALGLRFHGIPLALAGGAGVQARARDARYRALRALATERGLVRVALGHTQDDQAETVLARLLRGASVAGLAAIGPRRGDGVIRPLIDCRRHDILEHLRHHGLSYATDPSNVDPRFLRARVRTQLLPNLLPENPALVEQLASLADDARATRRLVRGRGRHLLVRAGGPEKPRVSALRAAGPASRKAALALWLGTRCQRPVTRVHIEALDRMLRVGGQVRLGDGWSAAVIDGNLVAERVPARTTEELLGFAPPLDEHPPEPHD